jgi:hypothetical protein
MAGAMLNPANVVWGKGYLYGGNSTIGIDTVPFGELQDITITDDYGVKELTGPDSLAAIGIGATERKVTGSAKYAKIRLRQFLMARGGLLADVNAGALSTTTSAAVAIGQVQIPVVLAMGFMTGDSVTLDTLTNAETVTITNVDIVNNLIYITPATAKSHASGVTFSRTTGAQRTLYTAGVNDEPMQCQLHLMTPGDGSQLEAIMYGCVAPKLSMQIKTRDFVIPQLDFNVYGNGTMLYQLWLPGDQTVS